MTERPGLIAQLLEDWRAHDRDWTRPGFRAVAVHRLGTWGKRAAPKPLRAPVGALYEVLYRGVRNFYGIEIPGSVQLGRRVVFEHQSAIVIHENAHIGDDCFIRQGVALGSRHVTHGSRRRRTTPSSQLVETSCLPTVAPLVASRSASTKVEVSCRPRTSPRWRSFTRSSTWSSAFTVIVTRAASSRSFHV